MLHHYALKSKKYDIIQVKLTNVKFLVGCLTGQILIHDCYNELIQVVRDYLNQMYDSCQQFFAHASQSIGILSSETLEE